MNHIFRLFRNYFNSKNLEGEVHVYVFSQQINVFFVTLTDICKLIRQVTSPAPPVVALASKQNLF